MKIKYSFNSMASLGVRGRGLYIGKFCKFLEQNQSLCFRLPHCINLRKITRFPRFYHTVSLSMVPGPRGSASPVRNANYWAHSRPTELETLGVDPSNLLFDKPLYIEV